MIEINGVAFFSADEAASALGVKVATLYAYASRGLIRPYRQGTRRTRLYRREDVEAMRELEPANVRVVTLPRAEDWVPYT